MSWEPILDGELAGRAWSALRAIADDLATRDRPIEDLAMFWSYVAPALGEDYDAPHEIALRRLPEALERITGPGLFNGLAGLGWTVAHCTDGAEELLEVIDSQLVDALRANEKWPGHFDLITGLAGIAMYFFERGDAVLARIGLEAIAGHLSRIAERSGDLVTWHSPLQLLPPHEHERNPSGWYNCGVAHGVPGVIAVLGRMPESPEIVALRDSAIAWLDAQHTPDPSRSRFPNLAAADHFNTARTAWCYGDAGIVGVLWATLRRSGRDTVAVEELALALLARPLENTGVRDAPLCHGAAGLAHLANRLFHATANPAFRALAHRWYEVTLDFAKPGTGIGGFSSWRGLALTEAPNFYPTPDFLDGAAGIGLALAAALTPIAPDWDRLLLLDLPVKS